MKTDTKIESAPLFIFLLAMACLVARWTERKALLPPAARAPAAVLAPGGPDSVTTIIRGEKLDINRIGARELELLPNIGRKTAEEIVRYRERHGRFRSVEELVRVKGVGSKTAERLAGWLMVL